VTTADSTINAKPGINSSNAAHADDAQNRTVKLKILGKDMQIGCSAREEHNLRQAAQHVHSAMQKSRDRNKTLSVEKVAILTAINLANELLQNEQNEQNKNDSPASAELSEALKEMADKIDSALTNS